MSKIQIKDIITVDPLKLWRTQHLTDLIRYLEIISEFEKNNSFIKELIEKSKKRYNNDMKLLAKGRL